MVKRSLTPEQQGLLRSVLYLTERLGRAPSLRELQVETGRDLHAIHTSMRRLEKHGLATCPRVVQTGEWGVTPKGKEAIDG